MVCDKWTHLQMKCESGRHPRRVALALTPRSGPLPPPVSHDGHRATHRLDYVFLI